MKSLDLTRFSLARSGLAIALATSLALVGFMFARPAHADVDPGGCTENGGGISLGAFRADGVTAIGAASAVADGELIKYQATLFAAPPPNCAFQGGTWTLTTPDGVSHDLGVVPKIGGLGVSTFSSSLIDYTVSESDEIVNSTHHIDAITAYSGGISHADAVDETAGPTLGASKIINVVHTPVVTTNVHDASHSATTSVAIGTIVHDNASVAPVGTTTAPTGTIDFHLFSNPNCSGATTTIQSGVVLVAGSAESTATSTPATGLSYIAHYNGQAGVYTPADGVCEPLAAAKLSPTVTTDIHDAAHAVVTSVAEGASVHDSATVTGGGPTPTGDVNFTFFSGANADVCDASSASAGTVALDGSGVAHPSNTEGPLTAGTYGFQASYVGDANYLGGTGPCEPLTVVAKGHIIVDKVTDPAADPQSFSFTAGGTGYIDFSLADADTPNDQTLDAGSYSISETVPDGWDQTSATCVSSIEDTETIGTLELDAGETITCTFTNTKRGHIIVNKVTDPSADLQSFDFTTTGTGYTGFSLTDAATPNDQTLDAGSYSVAETPVSGWDLTSANCVSSIEDTETAGALELDVGETITCTFTNTKVEIQYCSPGYWKQSQHFDSWVDYEPTDLWSSVFSPITIMWSAKGKPTATSTPTLLQALEANGGGINLLARAAVDGLLNAVALTSGYTTAEVIAIVNAAITAGTNSAYQAAAAQLTAPENCPLN